MAGSPNWSSQVTPSGDHLLFVSRIALTEDGDGGGVRQAYLYSAATGSIECVSCRRDGGVVDPAHTELETGRRTLAVNNSPAKVMSDDGSRIVFARRDRLAPGGVDGQLNLYLWKNGQVSLVATSPRSMPREETRFMGFSFDDTDLFLAS